MSRKYSDKEKAEYYKKKALGLSIKKSNYVSPRKTGYRKKYSKTRTYKPSGLFSTIGGIGGTALGTYLGGPAGGIAGGTIGKKAGDYLSKITGFGDYKVSVNTLVSGTNDVPEFYTQGPRCTIVRHREFIGDVVSGGLGGGTASVFSNNVYTINAANSQTFPWLSLVAQNYEQYRFHGLIFEFKTTSGAISSSPMLGTVVMATQYNSLAPAFSNKQQMENYEFAGSTVPSASLIHPIECDPKQTQCNGIFNNLVDGSLLGGDSRLYDLGKFNIATVGLPVANEVCGELWVSYECCLLKPRLTSDTGSLVDHWAGFGVGLNGSTNYFGTDIALTTNSDNFTTVSGTTIVFNSEVYGQFLVMWSYIATGTAATPSNPTLTGTNGAVLTTSSVPSGLFFVGSGSGFPTGAYAANAQHMIACYFFMVQPLTNGTSPTITFSSGSLTSTPSACNVFVMQLPTTSS